MSTAPSPLPFEGAHIVISMGVSSSGKTVVGEAIARRLHAPFLDGDDFHPAANIKKMSAGIPLTDDDRWPWLERLAKALHQAAEPKGVAVGACSSLKRAYRDYLVKMAGEPIVFVYLEGSYEVIDARIKARTGHFMPESLLRSQFATLEPPAPDENAISVPVTDSIDKIAETVVKKLSYLKSFKRGQ
jgi:carbohydrate kinase (thermoresistant glucokinase family)